MEEKKIGKIKIADEVVATIAGLATIEVPGIAGMSGGLTEGFTEMLGRKNLSKGVKVQVGEHEAVIELNVIVLYGTKINEICREAQEKVAYQVNLMTGLKVLEVNVNVQGVLFPGKEKDEGKLKVQ